MNVFIHGNNLEQKETHRTKYRDDESRQFLAEIRVQYNEWKEHNTSLVGPSMPNNQNDTEIINQRVNFLNNYKDFIDQQHYAEKFDSRSNLHSSVLEEFLYYLFRDLVSDISANALIGKAGAFKDIFFRSDSYSSMIQNPNVLIEKKDHDFVIGANIHAKLNCEGSTNQESHDLSIPAISMECKTYLDKTMLQDASTAAEQLKLKNPNAAYFVIAERLKLTEAVNLAKYKIDQIYILRRQINTDREFRYDANYVANPIYPDIVERLFNRVRNFLTHSWSGSIADGLQRGYLMDE